MEKELIELRAQLKILRHILESEDVIDELIEQIYILKEEIRRRENANKEWEWE